MLKIITVGAAAVASIIAIVLVYAATRPDRFRVQRSTSIQASAEKIFPLITNLRTFNTWNPYEKKDPNIKGTYSGSPSGTGAGYDFESTKAGTGRIEITEITPPSKITMKLTMIKPLHADNRVEFTLEPQGDATRVTWAMDGQVPFVGKVIHLIFVMAVVGREFQAGGADLNAPAERSSSGSR